MNNYFKTPEIFNLINYLKNSFPDKAKLIDSFSVYFSEIDLSQHDQSQESFRQTINLYTGDTIQITYNIDDLISEINRLSLKTITQNPQQLLNEKNFANKNCLYSETGINVKNNLNRKYEHKTDYIILSNISLFPELTIIDGNHRFCRALLTNQKNIKICIVPEEIAIQFLQKESFNFITLLYALNYYLSQ